jgi:long-chain acyl-CoA synthetase
VHVRIVDNHGNDAELGEEGELIVHGKGTMKEWRHKPEEIRGPIVDGWVHAGDLAR